MEEKKIAIKVDNLEKAYKLYDKPSDRLKEALGLSGKKRYKEHYALKGVNAVIYQGFRKIHHFEDYHRRIKSHQRKCDGERPDFSPARAGGRL